MGFVIVLLAGVFLGIALSLTAEQATRHYSEYSTRRRMERARGHYTKRY